jgi:hypothetical protein
MTSRASSTLMCGSRATTAARSGWVARNLRERICWTYSNFRPRPRNGAGDYRENGSALVGERRGFPGRVAGRGRNDEFRQARQDEIRVPTTIVKDRLTTLCARPPSWRLNLESAAGRGERKHPVMLLLGRTERRGHPL